MARIRTIKPEFFRHHPLFLAEKETGFPLRIAFAGLWTAVDREGRFRWVPEELKLDCLPYDPVDFILVLNALEKHGFIQSYEVDGCKFGWVPSWKKHQHINVREASSQIPAPPETDHDGCVHVPARGEGKGREGKGREEERKGRESEGREGATPSIGSPFPVKNLKAEKERQLKALRAMGEIS